MHIPVIEQIPFPRLLQKLLYYFFKYSNNVSMLLNILQYSILTANGYPLMPENSQSLWKKQLYGK